MANKHTKKYWHTRRPAPNDKGELFCNACSLWKHPDLFRKVSRLKYGKDHYCKECRNEKLREIGYRLHGKKPKAIYEAERHLPLGTCSTCRQVKDLSEFYKISGKRGYHHVCIACNLAAHQARRKDPAYLERRRIQARNARKKLLQTPEGRMKYAARQMVMLAIKGGFMVRKPCEVCGAYPAEADHRDYSKPLDVQWLCRTHHNLLRRTI